MLIVLCAMAAGIPPGYLLRRNALAVTVVGRLTLLAVYGLLFLLGAALGADAKLFAELPQLGGRGMLIGFFCSIGSVLCTRYAGRFLLCSVPKSPASTLCSEVPSMRNMQAEHDAAEAGKRAFWAALKSSGAILAVFLLGLVLGRCSDLLTRLTDGQALHLLRILTGGALTEYVLVVLMFAVGMGLGFDVASFGILRELRCKVLLVPLCIMAGTFLGAFAAWLLLPGMALHETLGVGAGFGYYSLSSVIITQLGDPALGSTALLSNIFRELFTLASAPVLVRLFGLMAPLASAGATAMDTCLPVIVRFSGERCGIIAVFSGMALTLAVPVLVPALLALGRF